MEDVQGLIFQWQLKDIEEAIEQKDLDTLKNYWARSYYLDEYGEIIRLLLNEYAQKETPSHGFFIREGNGIVRPLQIPLLYPKKEYFKNLVLSDDFLQMRKLLETDDFGMVRSFLLQNHGEKVPFILDFLFTNKIPYKWTSVPWLTGRYLFLILESYVAAGRKNVAILDRLVSHRNQDLTPIMYSLSVQIKKYGREDLIDFIIENMHTEENLLIVLQLLKVEDAAESRIAEKSFIRSERKSERTRALVQKRALAEARAKAYPSRGRGRGRGRQ